jgi:hypothetical protein
MKTTIGVIILIGICIVVWALFPKSHDTISISDIGIPHSASVRAPSMPFRDGAMYVLYEGSIDSDARIEVTSNRGRDQHTIDLKKGSIAGAYGGPEHWVDDLTIEYNPMGATTGEIKIGLYCGTFTEEGREWYRRITTN